MIRFVDINTGKVFNGDAPYTHWFEGIQSMGIIYAKRFICISDSSRMSVSLDSEVFSLVDESNLTEFVEKHDKKYLDLSKITTKALSLDGSMYQGYYLFTFNIIAKGLYVGEVTDQFTIDGNTYNVGADFTDENESLSTNLTNLGMDIPNEIQRSIYEQNIHEQKPDYVLLNRKYKELLNEYINIIANKGSYKSLINSVRWFEYGDLVKIYEYWRHEEPTRKILSKNDITQYVNEKLESVISAFQKTTYIGLSAALTNCKIVNGEIQYIHEITTGKLHAEPLPEVENIATLWSRTEMSLKMVLLGNFFATYFMPIHLDLIHCTIEDVVFADTIKLAYLPKIGRFDNIDNLPVLCCKLDDVYHLDNIETFTNNDTPFGYISKDSFTEEDAALEVCGVDTEHDTNATTDIQMRVLTQHFKGIGTLIPFHCVLNNVTEGNYITTGVLYVYKDGELVINRETSKVTHTPTDNKVVVDFNLLIQQAGKYTVQLLFARADGCNYAQTFNFTVDGQRYQNITMFRIVPRYTSTDFQSGMVSIKNWIGENSDQVLPFDNIADYVLDPVASAEKRIYMQFLASNQDAIDAKIHMNQIIVVRANKANATANDIESTFKCDGLGEGINFKEIFDEDNNFSKYHLLTYSTEKYSTLDSTESETVIATLSGNQYTWFFCINTEPITSDNSEFLDYKCDYLADGEKVYIFNAFIPYFYKLEKFGEVSLSQEVEQNLTEEQIYQLKNNTSVVTINKSDVICFLPELRCIKRPTEFMWKYICQSSDLVITPKTWRDSLSYEDINKLSPSDHVAKLFPEKVINNFPTIIQPLFGRYDFSILPTSGYYDVILNYKLDDSEDNQTRSVCSQFIVSK